MDPIVAAKSLKELNRERRTVEVRWYSRVLMLECAMEMQLDSVDAMSDAQFDEALERVHAKLMRYPTLRQKYQLEPNRGPASSTERKTEMAE